VVPSLRHAEEQAFGGGQGHFPIPVSPGLLYVDGERYPVNAGSLWDPHISHVRLVHFWDLSGNPENKATSMDERHPRRWGPTMLNRIQRRQAGTTKLVSLQLRRLVSEPLISGFPP
jgi:hypothetical protein